MRSSHHENPFHRIERWNGSYYRPAELREVGTYLLVRHHTGEEKCETLTRWCSLLDTAELTNDSTEQEELQRLIMSPGPGPGPGPRQSENSEPYHEDLFDIDGEADMEDTIEIDEVDLEDDDGEDLGDGDEELEDVNPYFPYSSSTNKPVSVDPALAFVTFGALLRVVHTNGLHHIPMVSCQCHGEDVLALDLFAAHLLPASLKRIKTIFTAQVLDHFRLCNLELKASAYQFYQLLRRLTKPMAPAEVLNLYREFRRMTRIWHWMKRLKWSGHAGSSKKVKDIEPGELAIFCPACPQPGINLPDNWKNDNARYVNNNLCSIRYSLMKFNRWVYKRVFVADGNFKADHVRQKNEDDIWLSEGSGMIPRRDEYFTFLATAIERLTVSY